MPARGSGKLGFAFFFLSIFFIFILNRLETSLCGFVTNFKKQPVIRVFRSNRVFYAKPEIDETGPGL